VNLADEVDKASHPSSDARAEEDRLQGGAELWTLRDARRVSSAGIGFCIGSGTRLPRATCKPTDNMFYRWREGCIPRRPEEPGNRRSVSGLGGRNENGESVETHRGA
jgi:hypothetical protein